MSTSAKHPISAPGVVADQMLWGFMYRGRREAILAAGLVPPGNLPGDPGQRKTSAWYMDEQGRKVNVRLSGKLSLDVYVNFTKDEQRAADEAREAEKELAARHRTEKELADRPAAWHEASRVVCDDELATALTEATAGTAFKVGDAVVLWEPDHDLHGMRLEVVEGYRFRVMADKDGPYVDKEGTRYGYFWGYKVKNSRGKYWVVRPHQLRGLDMRIAHLRRVA